MIPSPRRPHHSHVRLYETQAEWSESEKSNYGSSVGSARASDQHQDDELKDVAQDYIRQHNSEILRSQDWQKFGKKVKPLLEAVETYVRSV
ncbi:hypothetical protein HNY73_018520 [Argiope bruennichi]|uniref:Uncharacterized protein n=1 Tax=Argiope bruennichi TaxID=94029 RepID=A0A8T0EH84_ARGBR|nr:hypothetical protein HNY73_018520 [Argiope bruennichi]